MKHPLMLLQKTILWLAALLLILIAATTSSSSPQAANPAEWRPVALDPATEHARCRKEVADFSAAVAPPTEARHQTRLQEMGWKLVQVSDRPDFPYQFLTFGGEAMQAFAFTACAVGVNESLIAVLDDDQLAFVVGHELAHVVLRHPVVRWQTRIHGDGISAEMHALDRDFQTEADRMGALYAVRAGFDYAGSYRALERLRKIGNVLPMDAAHAEFQERARDLRGFRGTLERSLDAFERGVSSLELGDAVEAIAMLEFFAAEFPCSVAGNLNLGTAHLLRVHQIMGGPGLLSEIIPPLVVLDHGFQNVHRAPFNNHHLYWAHEYYRRALEIDPEEMLAHMGLGLAESRTGQLVEARMHFKRALEHGLERPAVVMLALGNVEFLDGRLEDAVECYLKCLELERDLQEARRNLALTYERMGLETEAREQWEELIIPGWVGEEARSHLVSLRTS